MYCNAGPRGLPAPSHNDTAAPDDAGPRAIALRALVIAGAVIVVCITIGLAIICCRRSSRSSDL